MSTLRANNLESLDGVGKANFTVDTIAELRTLDPIIGMKVLPAGYHTPGDGGGGPLRVWKTGATGTYTDNGGSVIVPTGGDGSGAWVWEWSGAVNVKWFGVTESGDQGPAINKALLASAQASGSAVYIPAGRYTIDTTIDVGPGVRVFGDGATDSLNSLSPRLGTELRAGAANPIIRFVGSSDITGWPSVADDANQGYGLKGVAVYSQSATASTGVQIGITGGSVLRNVYIEDITMRGFFIGIDVQRAYEVTIKRFSIREINRTVDSIGMRLEGEMTSGSITDGAIYSYDTGVLVDNIMAGAEVANIDFDNCNVCIKTEGFIYNNSLFRNIASENTQVTDMIFNHGGSSTVGVYGFATVIGTSSDHRIRNIGAGDVYLSSAALNSSLFASGKSGISVEGAGNVFVDTDSTARWFNISITGAGRVITPTSARWDATPTSVHTQKHQSIILGDTVDTRTIVISDIPTSIFDLSVIAPTVAGNNSITSWKVQRITINSDERLGTTEVSGTHGTLTVVGTTIEVAMSDTFNNATLSVSAHSACRIARKA